MRCASWLLMACALLLGVKLFSAPERIDTVWAGHPVGFDALIVGTEQFVAYYNLARDLCVAQRHLPNGKWTITKLPTRVGWDSHNFITLAVDSRNCLHLAGNMHCVPLIYFRSEKPLDASTLKPIAAMTGKLEKSCTYPMFMTDTAGNLIFRYRVGKSGNGDDIFNIYNADTRKWRRLLDTPIFSGEKLRNAYASRPILAADGNFHIFGVWRDTPDCSSNHSLFYIRSSDLSRWQTADGKQLTLPVKLRASGVTVDPTPVKGGLINMGINFGLDAKKRPVIIYHKYDKNGFSQIFAARYENRAWIIRQISDWKSRWDFSGGGSIDRMISAGPLKLREDGALICPFTNKVEKKSGRWILDGETLKITETLRSEPSYLPKKHRKVVGEFPGLSVKWLKCRGVGPEGESYVLRWETLGLNRDLPRDEYPESGSQLEIFRLGDE